LRVAVALIAVALAGCGAAAGQPAAPAIDMARYGPRHAVARSGPAAAPLAKPRLTGALDRRLRNGEIAVVDVGGKAGIRPPVLETSSDAAVEKLSWSSWGGSEASASGELRVLDCQPSCATGHTRRVAATVRLSDVRVCDGRRYFGTASVTVAEGAPPASYVRAPC
jgi:hypothetical protein